jgi:hypothetical protein
MPRSMRQIKVTNKGDLGLINPKLPTATRTTKPTSVMPISVTSHETTETVTTFVNGRAVHHEEVTKIYVIEPVEEGRRIQAKDGVDEGEIRKRRWLADMWLGIWAVWVLYLAWEWIK